VPEREFQPEAQRLTHLFSEKNNWPESCEGFGMILLVTPSERASECVRALHEATGEEVVVAESLARATTLLREECYLAVVLDQYLLESQPREAVTALEHLGSAIPVQVNLAISAMDRLVREVREAMQRRQREEARARQVALGRLQCELNGTVTALLLSIELALETTGLPSTATEKLRSIHELVKTLWNQLESTGITGTPERAAHV
jgi:CheY-like chemotaxis protein